MYVVYDMSGNVWEWVQDWYLDRYYSNSPSKNPPGPDTGTYHVVRGGAWDFAGEYAKSSDRFWGTTESASNNFGFRCARDANQDWKPYLEGNRGSTISVQPEPGASNSIRINFDLLQEDWTAVYKKLLPKSLVGTNGLTISYKGHGAPNTIEVKLIHTDETVCKKVIHNKTNTNNITNNLEISYSELECVTTAGETTVLNLEALDRLDLTFSNWPTFGDEPGEGEVIVESIQIVP